MRSLPLLLALLPACSLYDASDDQPAWLGDDLPACDTVNRAYRIDAITIPLRAEAAEAVGADLDGDGTIDNQAGNILSAIDQAITVDLQGAVDEGLAADLVQIGVSIDTCAQPEYALVSLVRGVDVDRTFDPPRMLGEAVTPYPAVAIGGLIGPAIDGTSRFPVAQLLHPSVDEWIDAFELTVVIDQVDDLGVTGHIAAAVDGPATYDAVSRAFQAKITDRIEELGPCTPTACDEIVETMLGIFDHDEDGVITLEEVQSDSLVMTLLRPDVDIDGDGEEDSLSVGVGFHASPVALYLGSQ